MSWTKTYSIANDFPNSKVHAGKLHQEILGDATITTTLDGINTSGDNCNVIFGVELGAAEKTALDTLVAAHDGVKPGAPISIARTIAGGVITIPTNRRKVLLVQLDVESGSSDNLDAILGGDIGTVVTLWITSNARPITVRDNQAVGADKIEGNGNFLMNQIKDKIRLVRRNANVWDEVSRSPN